MSDSRTQSVCKHPGCGKNKNSFVHLPIKGHSQFDHHAFEPVAEPESTGEQKCVSCSRDRFHDVHLYTSSEFYHPYVAARPSEPSAPHLTKSREGVYEGKDVMHKVDAARLSEIAENFGKRAAALQPVSGDAPGDVTSENIFKYGARTGGYPCLVCHTTHDTNSGCPAPSPTPSVSTEPVSTLIVMGTSVLIPLNRYNEFVEFESGRSIKSLSLFAADIEDTLHAIANIVGIEDRLDPAIIEAVRKLAAPSVAGTQPTQHAKLFAHIEEAVTCVKGTPGGACRDCIDSLYYEYEKLFPDAVGRADSAPAQGTPEPPKVEEIAKQIAMECYEHMVLSAAQELRIQTIAAAILRPYFTPSPAHFSDCDYDCSCGWKKDPDSHLGAVRD